MNISREEWHQVCENVRDRRATKIEHIRPVLLHFLREERAFLSWVDRDRRLWEEMVDWEWAVRNISGLES